MRYMMMFLIAVTLSACSSARLKRCVEPVKDDLLWTCKDHVDGAYYRCQQPEDLYRCQDVQ